MNLLRVLLTRTDIVEAKVAELEKKQARAQAKQAKAERKQRESELSWSDRERLDPVAVRTAAEIARQRAREAALAIEQDVVRRVNARFGPDGAGGSRPPDPPQDGSSR